MEVIRKELCAGVGLTAIRTGKFKSGTLSVNFLAPLSEETAARNALVPHVLRRGCETLPTMAQVSARLEELYGSILEPVVRRRGETQCVGLYGSFLDDAYTLDEGGNLEAAGHLLAQLILHPVTEKGVFCAEYVRGEKENLIQAIRSEMNEKWQYAVHRLTQEMCRGERYGVPRCGTEKDVAEITPETLWAQYGALLRSTPVEIHYCGTATCERVEAALRELTDGLQAARRQAGQMKKPVCAVVAHRPVPEVRRVTERLDVAQGKLALGFRTGGVTVREKEFPALTLLNAIYGGTSNSKLFMNVRERLSLCYHVSSTAEQVKGVLVVSSGVEFGKMDEAQGEILAQLDAIKAGKITEEELRQAKQTLISSYRSLLDSRNALESYWLSAAVTGQDTPPEERLERLRNVTQEDVTAVAQGIELDTVYRLVGKEAGHD